MKQSCYWPFKNTIARNFTNFISRAKGDWDPSPPKWASFSSFFFFSLLLSNLVVGRNDWFSGRGKKMALLFQCQGQRFVPCLSNTRRFQMCSKTTTFECWPHTTCISCAPCWTFLWLGWFCFVTSAYSLFRQNPHSEQSKAHWDLVVSLGDILIVSETLLFLVNMHGS